MSREIPSLRVELYDAIESWGLGYHESCIVQLLKDAGHTRPRIEDLREAQSHLERLLIALKEEKG